MQSLYCCLNRLFAFMMMSFFTFFACNKSALVIALRPIMNPSYLYMFMFYKTCSFFMRVLTRVYFLFFNKICGIYYTVLPDKLLKWYFIILAFCLLVIIILRCWCFCSLFFCLFFFSQEFFWRAAHVPMELAALFSWN